MDKCPNCSSEIKLDKEVYLEFDCGLIINKKINGQHTVVYRSVECYRRTEQKILNQNIRFRKALEEVLENHATPHNQRRGGCRSTTKICSEALFSERG